jgi:hypothetical protein
MMIANPGSAEQTLAELTDKIAAASLALQPLCNDSSDLPNEAQRIVRDVCAILHSAKVDLINLLDPFPSQQRADGDASQAPS